MKNYWQLESKWEQIYNNREDKNHRAEPLREKTTVMVRTTLAEYQTQSEQVKRKARVRQYSGIKELPPNPSSPTFPLAAGSIHI